MKDGLVRADELPLVFRALGAETLPRGAHVRVRIGGIDLLTLDLHASVVARLDDAAAASADDAAASESTSSPTSAGPLTLAIDVAGRRGRSRPPPAAPSAADRRVLRRAVDPADRADRLDRRCTRRC